MPEGYQDRLKRAVPPQPAALLETVDGVQNPDGDGGDRSSFHNQSHPGQAVLNQTQSGNGYECWNCREDGQRRGCGAAFRGSERRDEPDPEQGCG